jgi:hypothetical protein
MSAFLETVLSPPSTRLSAQFSLAHDASHLSGSGFPSSPVVTSLGISLMKFACLPAVRGILLDSRMILVSQPVCRLWVDDRGNATRH